MRQDPVEAGVQVLVLNEKGKVVEKREAIKSRSGWWEYIPNAKGMLS